MTSVKMAALNNPVSIKELAEVKENITLILSQVNDRTKAIGIVKSTLSKCWNFSNRTNRRRMAMFLYKILVNLKREV